MSFISEPYEEKRMNLLIGYYGYWVILSYLSVIAAVVGMTFAIIGNIRNAIICLIICGICDMLDGSVARAASRNDREKSFGIQIDSLADVIGFGVFPAVLGYVVCSDFMVSAVGDLGIFITLAIASAYVLAALIRLAYFNVIEMEFQNKGEKRSHYVGLPVTNAALILPVAYSCYLIFGGSLPIIYLLSLFIISIAFILKVKIPKVKMRYVIIFCLILLPFVLYAFITGGA